MSHRTVLVADDDQNFLHAMSFRLRAAGYGVICCQDGYQAVAMAQSERPDLMLLDINMPAGGGFSVHQRVWQMVHLCRTPVIYISGDRSTESAEAAHALGALALMRKPIEIDELLGMINDVLRDPGGQHKIPEICTVPTVP